MNRALPLALVAIATFACTTAYAPPALGPDHPADPRAAEAPPPAPSTALASEPRERQPERSPPDEHEHHGMHGEKR